MWFRKRREEEDDAVAYPNVPNTLRADSVDHDELEKTRQARPETASSATPYLGLRARLSQVWFNRWTILLLLVLVRVLFSIAGVDDNVDDAEGKALSACTKVEDMGSAMASMPHYLSAGVNEMSAKGIESTMDGLVAMLDLVIVGVQELIIFIINMVTSMYTCLILAFIESGLDVAAHVTESVTEAMNDVVGSIANSIESRAGDIEDGINSVKGDIEDSFIGGILPDFPDVDLSGPVGDLKDIEIDASGFVQDIRDLNDNLPSFDEVQNMTAEAIRTPFGLLRELIDDQFDDFSFDRSMFPVAEKQALNFCSNNNSISDFFSTLRGLIKTARTVFIVVLVLLALLAMAPMAWYEIMRWRRQKEHARIVSDKSFDPMDVMYIAGRTTSAGFGIKLASRFSGKRQVLVRWAWAYGTSLPALFVLALAIAGFISIACQAILLRVIEDQVPRIANEVGEFADEVVTNLEAVSQDWADSANDVVLSAQDDINDDLFGWAREATSAVNDTMDTFIDTMNEGLEFVFNDTILIEPIKAVVHCTVGLKVESFQKGLTWVHDNAKVAFPTFANDTFSSGAEDSMDGDSFLAAPATVTTDEITDAVQRVVDRLRSGIITEALISTGILLVYIIAVLIGIVHALINMSTSDKERAEGGDGHGFQFTSGNPAPMSSARPGDGFQQYEHDNNGGEAYARGSNGWQGPYGPSKF